MRAFGTLLIVCVALAVVKAAIAVLLLALVIAVIWAACRHPRETFGIFAYFTIIGLVGTYPFASLAVVGASVICLALGKLSDQRT